MKQPSRTALFAGAALAIVVLMINVALSLSYTRALHDEAGRVDHTGKVIAGLENILSLAKDAETGQRGFVITGEPRYLEPYNAAVGAIDGEIDKVQQLTTDNPPQQARIPELRQNTAARLATLAKVITYRKTADYDVAQEYILLDQGKREMDALRRLVAEMVEHERGLLRDRATTYEQTYRHASLTACLSGLLALLSIGAFLLLLRQFLAARDKAAKIIAEQSERLRTTLASIGDGVIATDRDGRITIMNPVAETLTAWKTGDAIGKPLTAVFNIVNETTREPVANPATRALTEGVIVGLANHTILIAKDGGERAIDDSAAPIRCKDGEIVGCVLVFRDVADKRAAEIALEQNEERFKSLVTATAQTVWITDSEGRIELDSPTWRAITGQTYEQGKGMGWLDALHPDDREPTMATWRQAVVTETPYQAEYRLRTKTGEYRWTAVRAVPVYNLDGGIREWIGTNTDVDDKKRADRDIAANEARLRFLMNAMPQKIFTATASGDVDYFNPVWMEFTGLSFERIRDWGWTEFIHPDDVDDNVRAWTYSVETGEPFLFEHRFRRADGEYRWHISRAVAFKNEAGEVQMWVGSNTDIHEQKQTANELRDLAAQLSEADRRKNDFLAMLAHELRNPLAPISNALRIVQVSAGDGEAVLSASQIMERQVRQMVRLVDDLLDVSRISHGKIELRREHVELAAVIQQAVESSRPAIDKFRHALTVNLPSAPIYLYADPVRMAQAFGNLLNNATKYSEPGGRIAVTAEQREFEVVISIKDSGLGISPEMLPNIFDMFTQSDDAIERAHGGLGIGLTLVRRLVELHKGSVSARSDGLGCGSEFVVRLPMTLSEPPALAAPPAAPAPARAATGRRVLVVDDNRDSAASMAMLMEINGNETRMAHDGLEALEAASAFRPDVVLLDIGLPELNGYEVARRIRQQPWGADVLLIALTGWGQDEDRRKSGEAGFNGHLVKPVDFAVLTKLLAELPAPT